VSLLEVRGASKRFGGVQALAEVSFEVRSGEILGLIGPNGAGKTTLFHLIAGTVPCERGEIIFQGRPIAGLPAHRICRLGLARTFQIVRPFGQMTCLENVLVAFLGRGLDKAERAARAGEFLALTGLAGKEDVPAGRLNLIDKKRLELARALATGPRLLLLDEVLGGLNSREMAEALDLMRLIRDRFQVTIFWIEHVMGAIMRLSERILVLDQGRLICQGPPEQVSRDRRVIEAYLGEQHAQG